MIKTSHNHATLSPSLPPPHIPSKSCRNSMPPAHDPHRRLRRRQRPRPQGLRRNPPQLHRHPDTYRFSIGGKQLPLSGLKPGTKLDKPVDPAPSPPSSPPSPSTQGQGIRHHPPADHPRHLQRQFKDFTVPAGTAFTVGGKPMIRRRPQARHDGRRHHRHSSRRRSLHHTQPPPRPCPEPSLVAKSDRRSRSPPRGTNLPLIGLGFVTLAAGFALRTYNFCQLFAGVVASIRGKSWVGSRRPALVYRTGTSPGTAAFRSSTTPAKSPHWPSPSPPPA